ncbi:DUF2194 domain-containing protein [Gillisia limnaea]|uniref:DUF2194 domain-containing protein n=1 Tax=Gillisia limnaea (strain DSM 15749 / LMG 21470 / R-8282) TaxID=865937 RepID=H2BR53_GILLR|nr:DUF2194 domain-containing protein [Gillisia limnaea]EHQ04372.1 Protein of unknown function DUF2194 [Gillisia limnaea DSM 15749]
MKIILPKKILKFIFLFLCFLTVASCELDTINKKITGDNPEVLYDENSNMPWVSYIYEPGDVLNEKNKNNVRKALNYAKIPYGEINLNEFNREQAVPNSVKVIVIYNLASLNEPAMNFLLNFVSNGGHIFIPTVGANKKFGFLAGVKGDANYEIDTISQGYKFKINFLPALKDKSYKNLTKHYGLKAENFKKDIKVLATSITEENYPLIIKNEIGKGSVIAINTEQFSEKQERGLFFAAILQGLEGVPYPIANASSIMLDDFPAPLYNSKMEPVQSEMGITQAKFYTEVWWKDMLKLAKKYDIHYSAYVCFDYSNQTSPPFNFPEWEQSVIKGSNVGNAADRLMIDFEKSSHEVALHGYNHASLTLEEWPNKNYMALSLESVKKRWSALRYGTLPVSYVPPSNIIDSIGFIALEENIPSIVYNASIYLGDFEEGGYREFDPEPLNYHFFNFPRISSGYAMSTSQEFNQQSLYLFTGIWTHFIHPDDIYQIPGEEPLLSAGDYTLRNANSYGWRVSQDGSPGLFPRFENYIKKVKETFPLIRFLKVSEAAKITKTWREIPYEFTETENNILVAASIGNSAKGENYWFSYVSEANNKNMERYLKDSNTNFTRTPFLNGFLFNIETREKELSLPKFNDYPKKMHASVIQDYESYLLIEPKEILSDNDNEILELKSRIAQTKKFQREVWLKLFQYLGWNDRQDEIWPLLERKYTQNKTSVYINLSEEFTKQSDYPNLETRRRWMLRQINMHPESVKLRRDFIGYFGSDTEVQLSAEELLKLIEDTKLGEERLSILLLLNEKYPETAFKLVKNIIPCREDFREAASTISWIFADAQDYKKAILWSKCSKNITESIVDDWRVQSGEYEFLKERNFSLYIEYLIAANNKKAAQELLEIRACTENLKYLATTIAYTYAGQGSYRKALEWSLCAKDFPLVERMYWLNSLGNYSEIERLYTNYSGGNNEEKLTVQEFMVEFYMSRGDIVNSWQMVSELGISTNNDRFRNQLNKDVVYLKPDQKRFLLEKYPILFYPEVAEQIKQNLRIAEGDFINIGSNTISDKLDLTFFDAEAVYGIRDKKFNQHQFGVSRGAAYEIPSQIELENNSDINLYGLIYRFKNRERIEKLNYGFGTRLEFSDVGKAYFHILGSASFAKDSLYSSFQFFRKPAITGPAYQLDIYQTQFNIYEELQFKEKFQAVFYLEGNHYNDDDVLDVQALTSLSMDFKLNKRAKFRTYTEIFGMLGNTSRPGGYPYWTLDERFYGGLGIAYEYSNEKNFWKVNLDAGYFLDTFSDEFQRYRGTVLWPISKYLHFNTQLEFYTLKNFYSNSFSFGLKYFLKEND